VAVEAEFTVVGYFGSTDEAVIERVSAQDWVGAFRAVREERGDDFELALVLPGRVEMVGTWEALPEGPPAWRPEATAARLFTVFGFDHGADAGRALLASGADWVTAAHIVQQSLGGEDGSFQLIAVAEGRVDAPRDWNWRTIRQAVAGSGDRRAAS
jgi:hypothetical protein